MTTPNLRRVLLAGLTLLLLAPAATAQLSTFGTTVAAGDSDYVVLTKNASKMVGDTDTDDAGEAANVKIFRANLGEDDDWKDDCIVIDTGSTIGKEADPIDDLRLSVCGSDPAGSTIPETSETVDEDTYTLQDNDCIRLRVADTVKQNDGYDKGEAMYLVYFADANDDASVDPCEAADQVAIPTTGLPRNEDSMTTEGNWAIRLTAYGEYPAGSWVRATDDDMVDYGSLAVDVSNKFTFADREDKTFYFIANTADQAAVAKNTLMTAKSVRVGPVVAPAAPLVQVSNIELPEDVPAAGEEYKVKVKYSNDGKAPGVGLLVTRLDGVIVDARLTPYLDAAQSSSSLVTIQLPEFGGAYVLDIAGSKVNLDVEGPLAPTTTDADLLARIVALETQLASLKTADAVAKDIDANAAAESVADESGIPLPSPALLLGALALLVVVLRRRSP